jgi:hypothetical protein
MYLSEKIIPWAGRRERDGELAGGQRSGAQPRRGRARTRETREGWLVRELFLNRRAGDLSSDARVTYRPGFFLARVRIDGFLGPTSIGVTEGRSKSGFSCRYQTVLLTYQGFTRTDTTDRCLIVKISTSVLV